MGLYRAYNRIQNNIAQREADPLVLDVVIDFQSIEDMVASRYSYYLASCDHRAILWTDCGEVRLLTHNERKVYCKSHLREC